jgi:SAM-dependent methyltransferase
MERRWGRNVLPEEAYVALECRQCGALYVDSDVTEDYLADLYAGETPERLAEVTGEGVTHEAIVAGRMPELAHNWQVMKRFRQPQAGDRLLDVGCQTGEFGLIAQRDRVQPFGAELSPEYAATAQRRWGPGSSVNTELLHDRSYTAGQFAYISTFETLEHMLDPIAALRRMASWLTEDGILALSVPSADYFVLKTRLVNSIRHPALGRFLQRGFQPGCLIPHTHIYTFSGQATRLSVRQAGLEILDLDVTGWYGRLSGLNRLTSWAARQSKERFLMAPTIRAIARRPGPLSTGDDGTGTNKSVIAPMRTSSRQG